jgi:tetratricopeptide (TPR) repeat protein
MFERGDEQYLIRAMNRNQVNLFVGAGFSTLARNRLGNPLPTGWELAKLIWDFLGYTSAFDASTSLAELYEALLASGKPVPEISSFLTDHLIAVETATAYQEITKVFWSRIYTTNIDNVLDLVYSRVRDPRLDVKRFPNDELPDRDATLDKIQGVFLHGKLPCTPSDVTFSISQFARRATPHDHLYDHFVRDYATKTTLFVGTSLNEPLLWQYIELRKAKRADLGEERPKSFLITSSINEPKRQLLSSMNVVPIVAETGHFLAWLASKAGDLHGKDDVLRVTIPGLVELLKSAADGERELRAVKEFGRHFHIVPTDPATARNSRSLFLLGASPKWEDLLFERDAPREVTATLVEKVERELGQPPRIALLPLLGSAGSGKSTLMRRAAIQLAQSGHTCYLTNCEELARFEDIARALSQIGRRSVLFFDNAETILGYLPGLFAALTTIDAPPICVVACRVNEFERIAPRIPDQVVTDETLVPHLSRDEIAALLGILDRENLLGRLKGMNGQQRITEFESKANKQILVAMREATSGRGFDEIIEDEFGSLVPDEAKVLYLCVALATEAGHRLTAQEFVGCSDTAPAECLAILNRNLRDIVLRTGVNDELLMLRHRKIAEHMVNRAAPRPLLRDAYLRLLSVLSTEIGGLSRRSRAFALFKSLIHHHIVFKRFEESFDAARLVYDSVLPKFSTNAQFLLQYGSLEMEAGNLEVAQNYLNQADSLDAGNAFIKNAQGQLLLKKAIRAASKAAAIDLRDEGSAILMENIDNPELDDAYCYHIYCQLRLMWIRVWGTTPREKQNELQLLLATANKAFRKYPRDKRISEVKLEVERDYYSLAVR